MINTLVKIMMIDNSKTQGQKTADKYLAKNSASFSQHVFYLLRGKEAMTSPLRTMLTCHLELIDLC